MKHELTNQSLPSIRSEKLGHQRYWVQTISEPTKIDPTYDGIRPVKDIRYRQPRSNFLHPIDPGIDVMVRTKPREIKD